MNKKEVIKTVKIDDLTSAPVPIHIHSHKQTERVSAGLNLCMPGQRIHVAELEGRMYIIDGHMLVEAYRRRGKKTVCAIVRSAKDIGDVIALHVMHNMSHPPNPVKLIRAILYMRKSGDSDERIAESLRVSRVVSEILRLKINEDAVNELEAMLDDISKLYYTIHHSFPMHLLIWIFKQSKEAQLTAAIALRQEISTSTNVPERKFVWPTPIEIRIIQKQINKKDNSIKGVPLRYDNEGMRGRPKNMLVGSRVINKPPSAEEIRKIGVDNTPTSRQKIVFTCPHGSLLYVDGKSRAFHVESDDEETVVKLQHIDIEDGVYKISKEQLDFMRVQNGQIFVKKCTVTQAIKYLSRLKIKKANVCILSSKNLADQQDSHNGKY